ncbi:zinc finger protein, putative [Plasmodium chabaudi chabaudi]|uniref:Zinc finger protein, putative n=1 Tax=Plasmodium chabaudi chabaudi TaxID=31271 RepID=A0A1C6YM71_PLACU|nr:zinc finger protein, putative [Plasmodium chabaudi chabaudi]
MNMSVLPLFHICSSFQLNNCLDPKSVYENFICSVCLDLCDTPVTTACNHICCYKCMYYSLLHRRICSICKKVIKYDELKKISGKLKKEYGQLRIKCSLCNEKIRMKNHKKHLSVCKYKKCKNYILGCEYFNEKDKVEIHEEKCEHRLINCSSCSNLFHYKNIVFVLSLKDKYELNIRSPYTYYSYYYNLLLNTNFNFFSYNYSINKNILSNSYISRKIQIFKKLQSNLDRHIFSINDKNRIPLPINRNIPLNVCNHNTHHRTNNNNHITNPEHKIVVENNINANNNSPNLPEGESNIPNTQSASNRNTPPPINNNTNNFSITTFLRNNADFESDIANGIGEANIEVVSNFSDSIGIRRFADINHFNDGDHNYIDNNNFIRDYSDVERIGEKKYLCGEYHMREKNRHLENHISNCSSEDSSNEESSAEEYLDILPLRKTYNFNEKNSKDTLIIIKEIFQFDNVDLSSIYIDNKDIFLCNKKCFINTIKNLKDELEKSLTLLYFSCCVGMPIMFSLGYMSFLTTKGVFKLSFLITTTLINLSRRIFNNLFKH